MRRELELFEDLSEVIALFDQQKKQVVYLNQAAERVFRNEKDHQILADLVLSETDIPQIIHVKHVSYTFRCFYGYLEEQYVLVTGKPYRSVDTDRVTGLLKVDSFYEMAAALIDSQKNKSDLFFVYFNVENFKTFNSEFGYEDGDAFLRSLAEILEEEFPEYLTGRTSNDHFIVLTHKKDLEEKISRIHERTHQLRVGAKMELRAGIYEYEEGVSTEQCHDRAKIACDTLKGNYHEIYRYYDENLRKQVLKEKYIIDHIDEAVSQEYLMVYYQPIKRVYNDKICAMESLVRWNDPQLGFLSPADFIPLLEKRHLIDKVDCFVLEHVCRDIADSRKLGENVVPVSVNLSRLDFQLMDVYDVVRKTTEKYDVPSNLIHIEITESALNDDVESLKAIIDKFHRDGFEVWLDDFGSEYSTLNSLQSYNFDLLKIDMKFFEQFHINQKARTIIVAIIDMTKRLHMRVLAEGIETKEQYEFLRGVGCDKAQGFYICRPKPLDIFYGSHAETESCEETEYFTEIGKVNFLSPNPLEDHSDGEKIYNVIPTAIVEYKNHEFEYFYANSGFLECLESMGVMSVSDSQAEINDDSAKLKTRLEGVAQKTHISKRMEGVDFIFRGQHINVRAREIACTASSQALFVTMFNLNTLENIRKIDHLETSLNYLYSIYDRVDLIDVEQDMVENIYLSAHYYRSMFKGKSLEESVQEYANVDIATEDRQKFLEFYDMKTLPDRIKKSGSDYIVRTIRTMTEQDGVRLQIYVIIQVSDGATCRYLSCVRDVNEEGDDTLDRRILPESVAESRWYQILSDELHASILEWDMKTGEAYASGRAYQYVLCHDKMDDILHNRGSMESVYAEDLPEAYRFFADSSSGSPRAEATLRLKMTDGTFRWSRMIGLFQYDREGNLEHVTGVILDVEKEQKDLEQAKFLNLMPTALGVFEVRDGVVRQLFMNDGYFRLVEQSREDRMQRNQNFLLGIHPDDRQYIQNAMKSVIDGAPSCSEICRVQTGSGQYKWIKFASSVAKREKNYLLVYSTYVSVENERLLNDIPGGVGIFDIKDGVASQRYMNDAYYRLVGDTRDERSKRNDNSFFNGVDKQDWKTISHAINMLIDGKDSVDFSYRACIKDGTRIWLRLEGNVVQRDAGHLVVYCSFSNVTEMYNKLEEQLKLTSRALEDVKRANEEKAEFYARMSHDMRTPMNGILGMAQLSKEERDPEKLQHNISMIESSGTYMLSLINDTLDMQRIENGKLQLMPQTVFAREFVENIASMIKPTARQKGVDFSYRNINMNLDCHVRIDGVRLKQIFMNLLSNAVKFTKPGGSVMVEMERIKKEGNMATDVFRIIDNGVGMSHDYLKNSIYSAYQQETNDMTPQYAGSGLGLAITKSLVELMGGTISVESHLGKGTTFTLIFDIEETDGDQAGTELIEKYENDKILKGKRILLFEDHPVNAEIAVRLLKKKGMEVECASNGQIGLDMFLQSGKGYYDAVLMDIRMPVMDGLEAAEKIRSLDRADARTIPIIAMTANAYQEDIQRTREAGMDAHLCKPVEAKKLYAVLETCLEYHR